MSKKLFRMISLTLAVVMLLCSMAVMAFAAEDSLAEAQAHVHDYTVTTSEYYVYHSTYSHFKRETHTHTCACGASFMEHHDGNLSNHTLLGGGTYAGTQYDSYGVAYEIYRGTCKQCNSVGSVRRYI